MNLDKTIRKLGKYFEILVCCVEPVKQTPTYRQDRQEEGRPNLLVHQSQHELLTHGGHLDSDVELLGPLWSVSLVQDLGLQLLASKTDDHVRIDKIVISVLHSQDSLHPLKVVCVH